MLSLGIDAGASSTKWTLLDDSGVLREGVALAMDGHINKAPSRARMIEVLESIVESAMPQKVGSIYAGITGIAETDSGSKETKAIFTNVFGDIPITLVSDIELGYRVNFEPGEGIFLYAGTGSIAMYIDAQGKIFRAGGWGYLLGDEGAGYWIGREAIRAVLFTLESGSLISPYSLEAEVLKSIHCADWKDIKSFVYSDDRAKIAELSLLVVSMAKKGELTAQVILKSAGSALANLVWRLEENVGLRNLPVIFAGGLSEPDNFLSEELVKQIARPVTVSNIRASNRAAELARK